MGTSVQVSNSRNPMLRACRAVVAAASVAASTALHYALGQDLKSGSSGLWCVLVGFIFGPLIGLLLTNGDERGMIAGGIFGAVLLFTFWFQSNDSIAKIIGGICRIVCGGCIAATLIAVAIYD